MATLRAFRLTALATVTMAGAIACARTPLPVAESSAAIAPASSSTLAIQAKTGATSCGADPFPAPYQSVDPCDQFEVSCAALSALFTWNPSIDDSIDAALTRAKPLIVKAGLTNVDGTPLDPYNTPDDLAAGQAGTHLGPKWEELRNSRKALAAYVAEEPLKPTTTPLYYIWQFEYDPAQMSADGTPKTGANTDGKGWVWNLFATVSGEERLGYKLSSTSHYGIRRPILDDLDPGFAPGQSKRWDCQRRQ